MARTLRTTQQRAPVADQVRRRARRAADQPDERTPRGEPLKDRLVPSGSTLLNLACTDDPHGAFLLGTMVNIIGDSSSGKTMLALSTEAEAARLERFNGYRLILDDAEAANEFDIAGMFGKALAGRLEPPAYEEGNVPRASDTIQSFKLNVLRAIADGRPFIYVLDSFDALTSDQELERSEKQVRGKETAGTYGMEKAKAASELFRIIARDLKKTRSLLIVISQVRENMDPMSFQKYKRSGGKALDFYAIHKIWLANRAKVKKKERIIGHEVRAKVDKNKITGKERTVDYTVFNSYGIDDTGSMVDFMVAEQLWPMKKLSVDARDLGLLATRDKLISTVETSDMSKRLRGVVGKAWAEIEASLVLDRLPKYGGAR